MLLFGVIRGERATFEGAFPSLTAGYARKGVVRYQW
jgi:hypothetical protein